VKPVGYAELIDRFGLETPAPEPRSYLLDRGHRRSTLKEGRREEHYPPRDDPGDSWTDHLMFALKRESLNLGILAALFAVAPVDEFTSMVRRSPTGRYARLAWFLFEWLTGRALPLRTVTENSRELKFTSHGFEKE